MPIETPSVGERVFSRIVQLLSNLRSIRARFYRRAYSLLVALFILASVITAGLFVVYGNKTANAVTTSNLNFQGRLLNASGGLVDDGFYNIQFNLYDVAIGGSSLWNETYLVSATQGVRIKNGYFSTNLGSITAFPNTINWDQELWLGMTVRGTGSCAFVGCTPTDAEMNPRFKLTAVPYAMKAAQAASVQTFSTNSASTNTNNVTIQSGNALGATSNSGDVIVDSGTATGTAGQLLFGTTNASSIVLGHTGMTTTIQGSMAVDQNANFNGNTTIGDASTDILTVNATANFNGNLSVAVGNTLTNAGSTVFTAVTIANDIDGGVLGGTAGATVDGATTLNANQTTAGQVFTLATPTDTTAGRVLYVNNTGSATMTVEGNPIASGKSSSFIWNGTAWVQTISFTSTGVDTVGGIDGGSYSANGASIAGTTLYLQSASSTHVGLVTIGAQNFAGVKTFDDGLVIAAGKSLTVTGGNTASRPASPTEGMVYFDTTTKQLLTYANGKWQADRSTATKIVAASNSSQALKDAADYVATGTGDQSTINAALTAAGDGKVYLAEGQFNLTGPVILANNQSLIGSGKSTTILRITNGINADTHIIENSDQSGGNHDLTITNMTIDGNTSNQTSGKYLISFEKVGSGMLKGFTMDSVRLMGAGNWDIIFSSTTLANSSIINSQIESSLWLGDTSATRLTVANNNFVNGALRSDNFIDSAITGNTFSYDSGIYSGGLTISGGMNGSSITGNTFNEAGDLSIWDGVNNTISGNTFTNAGIEFLNISDSVISSNSISSTYTGWGGGILDLNSTSARNIITSNKLSLPNHTDTDGIIRIRGDNNQLLYNNIIDGANGSGIDITATADGTVLSGNVYYGTSSVVSDLGTNTNYAGQTIAQNGLDILFKQANSTTAFAVQNASGVGILTVDTTNGEVELGNATTAGKLVVSDGSSNTVTILANSTAGNYTATIPTLTANDTFCMATLGNCTGGANIFTDGGAFSYLTTTTDQLVIGANTSQSAKLAVVGTANETQLLIKANATQSMSNPLVLLQNSSGSELARINVSTSSLYFGNAAGGSSASGANNTGIGASALGAISTGTANTTLGSGALASVSVNSGNTAVGYNAGNLATGTGNVLFGYQAGDNITTGSNNVIIGYDLDAGSATASNQLNIANLLQSSDTTAGGLTIGNGVSNAAPVAATLAATNSSGTNVAGAALTVKSGSGNGTAAGGLLTVQGGQGGATGTGGAVLIKGGVGGATSGSGGTLTLQGGNASAGNTNGSNVLLVGGTGAGSGVKGLVVLDTATYSAATVQSFTGNANITQANIDSFGSILISGDVAGRIATLTDPTLSASAAGRVIYVTNSGTVDITLVANGGGTALSITLKPTSTATMFWNGVDWTAAGASSSTDLQAAYNNTATSAGGAEIVLSSTGTGGLTVRNDATTPIIGGLLEVQTSIGSNLFTVNNNATEYASNGGAESATFTAWAAAPAGGTATRYTTAGNNIATGVGSVFADTTATANTGVKNTLTSSLTANLRYKVSYTARHTSSTVAFTTLETYFSSDGTSSTVECGSDTTIYYNKWTRVDCTFTPTAVGASNAIIFRHTDAVEHDFYIDNFSVTVDASSNHAVDGQVDSALGTNWQAFDADGGAGTSTATRDTTNIYDTSGAVAVATTAGTVEGEGLRNNMAITPSVSTQYLVTFYAKSTTSFTDIKVGFLPAGGSTTPVAAQLCADYTSTANGVSLAAQSVSTSAWTRVTCILTTPGSGISDPDLVIYQGSAAARTFYIDNLTITLNTNNSSNVQVGGGQKGGPTTLFTLDRSFGAPIADNNDAYLGSMYYDTSTGRIQCYEADGWGACGAAPDNIVNLNPEYAGAVLNGTGVGTMTADFCSNDTALSVNSGLCSTGQAKNYYKWTSPQATQQTYSIYVTYQLPATFNGFSSDDTVQLVGRVSDITNAAVTYEMFKSTGSAVTACGTETTVAGAGSGLTTQWYSVGINGNEATGCSFSSSSASNFVIFKINLKAKSDANAYVSTLSFTTTGR